MTDAKPDGVTALVERLRKDATTGWSGDFGSFLTAAADALERLSARLAQAESERDASRALFDALEVTLCGVKRERDGLMEALRFYGDRSSYRSRIGMDSPITRDGFGDRARAALEQGGASNG